MPASGRILILDFGSQYTQLIARRIRELKVYCEIQPFHLDLGEIRAFSPGGIVLSGGPSGVYQADAPKCHPEVFRLGVPVLGICYGQQLLVQMSGGSVQPASHREYGPADLLIDDNRDLFRGFERGRAVSVWMSHGDRVAALPPGFRVLARSANSPFAAVADSARRFYGVQFHPEVAHTPRGLEILYNFVVGICGLSQDWTMASFVASTVERVREQVGNNEAICALSGGVDSSVAAALVHRALGERLHCIFVDNGLLRQGEAEAVRQAFENRLPLETIDAADQFLAALRGVTDPERKRKIIGEIFIRVFEQAARRHREARFLVQGTLYPDVIESRSVRGPSATIKSHHNVGGLPERMALELLEPLRELFKDEVRELGRELGLPRSIVERQPFPGPGLAVRVVGEITSARLDILRRADAILQEEAEKNGVRQRTWQTFCVLLPVRSVGVMGDERTFEETVVIRSVTSQDGMTADWARLEPEFLALVSNRIINEVKGINRVLFDISSKPPATIEWE